MFMINKKQIICIILLFFLSLPYPLLGARSIPKYPHRIIGYGPITEDLVLPSSTLVHQNKLYVLDQYSITVFDVSSKEVVSKRLLDNQNFLANYESPKNLLSVISQGLNVAIVNPLEIGPNQLNYTQRKYYVQPTLCLDSNDTLYVTSQDGIHVISIDTLSLIRTIPYPTMLAEKSKEKYENIITVKLYKDQLLLLKTVTDYGTPKAISLLRLDLDGSLLEKVDFNFRENRSSYISNPDFIYIEEFHLYGIIHQDLLSEEEYQFRSIQFFTTKGDQIDITSNRNLTIDASRITYYQDTNQIILAGYDTGHDSLIGNQMGQFALFYLHLEKGKENEYVIFVDSFYQKEEFGLDCIDVTCCNDSIILISSGQFEENRNCRIYRIQNENITQYGTLPTREGQINGSMSFCVNDEDTLFLHSNGQGYVNIFKNSGVESQKMDLDLNFIGHYIPDVLSCTPFLGDMICYDQKMVFTGIRPNTITSYDSQEESWYIEFKGHIVYHYVWLDMQFYQDELYVLDTIQAPYIPTLYQPSSIKEVQYVKGFEKANEDYFEEPPIFVGFNITTVQHENTSYPQYQFLDCVHQTIWIYDHRKKLQEIVQLPQNENSFYSSFDLYPDGSWIVTDVTQHRLLHISRTGELIETIGSKGQVEIGTTQEAYLEKPDQFYFPLRAKIANNHIYVADFGNCRYHKIPIEPLSIQWKDDAIHHENVSIFSSESGILQCNVSIPSTVSYEVTSTVPWLVIRQQYGSLQDKQIPYHILAEQLSPWQTHVGKIRVTFPQKWSFLNHSIPISVSTIGSTVELTIGSNQASVDGKPVALEEGYIPVIKDGRTCIGIRFLTDYLFRSHATIEYKADLQRIKVTTKDHTIYMIINQDAASVDGIRVLLDVPPFIQEGRTMIPLRFVSESLEADVLWEASTQKITITYPSE